METKRGIVDRYYDYIEEEFNCETSEHPLGKSYVMGQQFGVGNFSRIKIEDGIEISKFTAKKTDLNLDNRKYDDNLLELGYCYSGTTQILSLPDQKEYTAKKGDIFIYKTLNDIDYFKFRYSNFKAISIHMDFDAIKNIINPIWEDRIIEDWNNNIANIFKGNILIVEKASYQMKKIAEELDEISTDNVVGYMKLKLKTIEFLDTLFQEKNDKKLLNNVKTEEQEILIKSQEIIIENLSKQISIKEIASSLNISPYKLQEAFKNITGDTAYEYIKKMKLEKAKELLKTTDMSILEIVNEIGYENPSKFSTLFKKYNNITPLKYRKLNA